MSDFLGNLFPSAGVRQPFVNRIQYNTNKISAFINIFTGTVATVMFQPGVSESDRAARIIVLAQRLIEDLKTISTTNVSSPVAVDTTPNIINPGLTSIEPMQAPGESTSIVPMGVNYTGLFREKAEGDRWYLRDQFCASPSETGPIIAPSGLVVGKVDRTFKDSTGAFNSTGTINKDWLQLLDNPQIAVGLTKERKLFFMMDTQKMLKELIGEEAFNALTGIDRTPVIVVVDPEKALQLKELAAKEAEVEAEAEAEAEVTAEVEKSLEDVMSELESSEEVEAKVEVEKEESADSWLSFFNSK